MMSAGFFQVKEAVLLSVIISRKAWPPERVEGIVDKKRIAGLNNGAIAVIENRPKQWPVNVYLFQTYSHRKAKRVSKPLRRSLFTTQCLCRPGNSP